ncbi:unnamed protein product [Prunus armeniaca]
MGDVFVEVLGFYSEGVEGTSVDKDLAYVKIRNIGSDDHRIGIGKDNAILLFFKRGDGFPADSLNFFIASSSYAENLRMPNGKHVFFNSAVVGVGYGRSSTDHVDMLICWLLQGRFCTEFWNHLILGHEDVFVSRVEQGDLVCSLVRRKAIIGWRRGLTHGRRRAGGCRKCSFGIKMLCFGMDGYLLHPFTVGCLVVVVDLITKLRRSEATFDRAEGRPIVDFWASRVFMVEPSHIFPQGLIVLLSDDIKVIGRIKLDLSLSWCSRLVMFFLNPIDFLEEETDGGIGRGQVVAQGFRCLEADLLASTVSLRFETCHSTGGADRRVLFLEPIVKSISTVGVNLGFHSNLQSVSLTSVFVQGVPEKGARLAPLARPMMVPLVAKDEGRFIFGSR